MLKDKKIFSVASFADVLKDLSPEEKREILNALEKKWHLFLELKKTQLAGFFIA